MQLQELCTCWELGSQRSGHGFGLWNPIGCSVRAESPASSFLVFEPEDLKTKMGPGKGA